MLVRPQYEQNLTISSSHIIYNIYLFVKYLYFFCRYIYNYYLAILLATIDKIIPIVPRENKLPIVKLF